jgi:hypothetical protein
MEKLEINIITIAGMTGFFAIWYCTGSLAAGWAFLAGAAVVGECTNALAARLDKMRQAIELSNILRGRGE